MSQKLPKLKLTTNIRGSSTKIYLKKVRLARFFICDTQKRVIIDLSTPRKERKMFLNKNFVLANELVKHMGIHIANISMLRQAFEDNNDFYNIQKLNSCTVINSKARGLPNNIKSGLSTGTFTDLSDKLPCTYVRNEYGVTERELMSSGIVTGIVSVSGKDFYVFSPEFVKTLKNRMCYVLDEQETQECTAKGQIIGSIELSKNKFIVWY